MRKLDEIEKRLPPKFSRPWCEPPESEQWVPGEITIENADERPVVYVRDSSVREFVRCAPEDTAWLIARVRKLEMTLLKAAPYVARSRDTEHYPSDADRLVDEIDEALDDEDDENP